MTADNKPTAKPATSASNTDEPSKNKSSKNKNRVANQAALELIAELYPKAFDRDNVRPLKIGIQEDIMADEKISKSKAKRALASYVRGIKYYKSLTEGADRVDLNGEAAGTVTAEEAAHAKAKLDEVLGQRKERAKQARTDERKQVQQQRKQVQQERKQQKQEYEERKQKREDRLSDKLSQLINKHQN